MANKKHRRGGRTTPKRTRPGGGRSGKQREAIDGPPPFVDDVALLLREPSPFELMARASVLIEVTTPRPLDRMPGNDVDRPDARTTFESFVGTGWTEMDALALAVAAMHPDAVLAKRLRSAVDPFAMARFPRWVGRMGDIEITGTHVQTDILGDGENVIVSWRWPDGAASTAFVYVDHNMGTLVKDAFVIPEEHGAVFDRLVEIDPDAAPTEAVDPAVARARIEQAIAHGERSYPPFQTDSWPSSRPMIEWVIGHLPAGGEGYDRPEWSEDERAALLDDFVAAPSGHVEGLDEEQVRELADPLIWFGCDYGPGDPLRWSPVSVEIVLVDLYPRKVLGLDDDLMVRVPDVLAGFVRFAHERKGIPTHRTDDTLEAVERWRPEFLEAVAVPNRSREANAATIARIAAGLEPLESFDVFDDLDDMGDEGDQWWGPGDDDGMIEQAIADAESELVEFVGGRAAYESVTDDPLGDVAFEWSGILTIKGVTKPVTFDVELGGSAVDPWGHTRLGLEGRAVVSRKDWGLTWNAALETGGVIVSDKVTLEFEVEAIKA